ncbi:ATP-binding cassette domain-containing protein [Histidinibacterium aquaticum]|uniref:ATP-binding cassette domain-containing protein n=1 Tax=Histidinibacterium aquaticum TaxID=2613962 RepID=A0A5J5GKM0_9RHOB|nr:ATP-binding cassette domain-containing protein [Histidinibacterium aquaticum]KAA9008022.1 ATP-binding cassette domain-containing protein [Histidinibacterium aquaticum]
MTLARLEGEGLSYGSRAVLREVRLALEPGERLVLLGRSGAGKTTLLNALYDRLVASGRRVALVPQDHALVPQLDVCRNVLMGRLDDHGALRNLATLVRPRVADRAEVGDLLERLGLGGLDRRPVGRLSGGQRQRVALARALYRGGEVLVADEPVSAVDETQGAALLDLVRERFSTAVLALHDVGQARAFATRLVGLKDAELLFDAPAEAPTGGELAALYAE